MPEARQFTICLVQTAKASEAGGTFSASHLRHWTCQDLCPNERELWCIHTKSVGKLMQKGLRRCLSCACLRTVLFPCPTRSPCQSILFLRPEAVKLQELKNCSRIQRFVFALHGFSRFFSLQLRCRAHSFAAPVMQQQLLAHCICAQLLPAGGIWKDPGKNGVQKRSTPPSLVPRFGTAAAPAPLAGAPPASRSSGTRDWEKCTKALG